MHHRGTVDVQAANQRTEVIGVLQALDLGDLRSERDGRLVASHDGMALQRTSGGSVGTGVRVHPGLAGSATRDQVGHVHGETVDHADLAVAQDAGGVTHELGLGQVRLHQDLTLGGGDDQPTIGLGHVGFVQHARQGGDALQDVGSGQRDGSCVGTEVVTTGDGTSGGTLVGGCALVEVRVQHVLINLDLHLHGSVVGEHVHQLGLGLQLQNVVHVHAEVLALVDDQLQRGRSRHFIGQVLTDGVAVDGDRGDRVDDHGVAHAGDVTLPVGVGDLAEHGGSIELLGQLAGPEGGDEGTGVSGTRVGNLTAGGVETTGVNGIGCCCGYGRHGLFPFSKTIEKCNHVWGVSELGLQQWLHGFPFPYAPPRLHSSSPAAIPRRTV